MATLSIKPRSRIFHGHEWVFSGEVASLRGQPADGEVISLMDVRGKPMGSAIFNSKSQIVARRFSRRKQDLDADFFRRRLAQAAEYRVHRGVDPSVCRLVWSESDGLPGLVVDRYGDALVVQTLTLGMDQRLPEIVSALMDVFSPALIVERNDAPVRHAEGMEPRTGVLAGEGIARRVVRWLDLEFEVDLLQGHKTGFYLDQAASYPLVAGFAKGRRVLDCFANQGAFSLCCARAGASEVIAVEIGTEAAALARENANRNGLSVQVIEANAFDYLKEAEAAANPFGLVILDPPSFTRSKGKLQDALRGYKEIHLRAAKLLAPGGVLAGFCCSHHVSARDYEETVNDALVDARRSAHVLARPGQAPDHPVLLGVPESEYLKGLVLEMAPGR